MIEGMDEVRVTSPSSDNLVEKQKPVKRSKKNSLDSPKMLQLHRDMQIWYMQEWDRQAANRFQMATDEDYYDNLQWTEEDANVVIDRKQAPVVYNEIKPAIDWIIGTERRSRIDFKVLARRKDGSDDAENKTALLKYLSDTNNAKFHRSRSFDDASKAGMGVIETGLRGDPTEELLFERYQDWRSTLYDSNAVELDLSDGRYFFRWKDLDEDISLAYFPGRTDIIRASLRNDGQSEEIGSYSGHRTDPAEDWKPRTGRYLPYDGTPFTTSQRRIVRFYECWYRVPVLRKTFIDGDLSGKKYDPKNPEHVAAINDGYGLYDKMEMEVRVAIYTSVGIVFEGASPYRHGKFPFVITWCYRRKRDNAPYGFVRALRDPQDGLNKRHSKAHWILSTNSVTMDEGAVEDIEELREELARPDRILVKKPGKEFIVDRDIALANEHIQLMDRDAEYMRQISSVNAENRGMKTNAVSGKAIEARQEQGSVASTQLFDNHRYALQQLGELQLSMIEQFYTEAKVIRITGNRGNAKYLELNTPDEAGRILNDITASQADFVIDEADYKSTLRQAMFESLFDMMGKMSAMGPAGLQAAINMLDLVVDMSDISNKDELVSRIRKINGQRDPDAEMTPEEQQAQQAMAEAQKVQEELAMQRAKAELAEIISKGNNTDAQALMKRVEALYVALQAGGVVATTPGAAVVADEIMRGAGFKDEQGQDPNIPAPQQPMQPVQPLQHPAITQGAQTGMQTPTLMDGGM